MTFAWRPEDAPPVMVDGTLADCPFDEHAVVTTTKSIVAKRLLEIQ
jgi:hypothetical protein